MLEDRGRSLLMDFGLARPVHRSVTQTAQGVLVGTPLYMSPEQIRGGALDARTDLYSLGITLFEMLTGRPPFEAPTAPALMYQILQEPMPNVREGNPEVSPQVAEILARTTAKDPDDRYDSAQRLCEDLDAVIRGEMPSISRGREGTGTTVLPDLSANIVEGLLEGEVALPPPPRATRGALWRPDWRVPEDLLNQPNVVATDRPSSGVRPAGRLRWRPWLAAGLLLLVGLGLFLTSYHRGATRRLGQTARTDADGFSAGASPLAGNDTGNLSETPQQEDIHERTSLQNDRVGDGARNGESGWNGDMVGTRWHLNQHQGRSECEITFLDNGTVAFPGSSQKWRQKNNVVWITAFGKTKKALIEGGYTEDGTYVHFLRSRDFSAELLPMPDSEGDAHAAGPYHKTMSLYGDLDIREVWQGITAWDGNMADTTWRRTRGTEEIEITFHGDGTLEYPEHTHAWEQQGTTVWITTYGRITKEHAIEEWPTEQGDSRYFLRGPYCSAELIDYW